MPTVGPSPTPTTGCDYCLAATHIIELDRQTIAKAMAKINQQAKEIAKLREALISVRDCLGFMFDQEDRDLVKAALQENECIFDDCRTNTGNQADTYCSACRDLVNSELEDDHETT